MVRERGKKKKDPHARYTYLKSTRKRLDRGGPIRCCAVSHLRNSDRILLEWNWGRAYHGVHREY